MTFITLHIWRLKHVVVENTFIIYLLFYGIETLHYLHERIDARIFMYC